MSISRIRSALGTLAIVAAWLVPSGCAAGHPVVVAVSGETSQSDALRAAARDAARVDKLAHQEWIGAHVVDTKADGLSRLSESPLDPSIVALVVLERTAHDEEPLDRLAKSGVPVIVLGSGREERARDAIRLIGAALRDTGWRGSPGDRARLAASLASARLRMAAK